MLGINPGSPGFATVRIEPCLGDLSFAEGKMPHPLGEISVKVERQGAGARAVVILPAGLDGEFVWKGERKGVMGGKVGVLNFR